LSEDERGGNGLSRFGRHGQGNGHPRESDEVDFATVPSGMGVRDRNGSAGSHERIGTASTTDGAYEMRERSPVGLGSVIPELDHGRHTRAGSGGVTIERSVEVSSGVGTPTAVQAQRNLF
jgi:hypothetical protein